MVRTTVVAGALVLALGIVQTSSAAVSAEEAAKLKTTLTPFGSERAGNKEGTIPAWDGGYTKPIPGAVANKVDPDPFPQEKPLFRITAKNAAQYTDKLSAGTIALLNQYPDTFFLDVYPTHRTVAYEQWIYDSTFKNATNAKLTNDGKSVEGAFGGIPFPIPKSGIELIWNHLLSPKPYSIDFAFSNYVGSSDGKRTLASRASNHQASPFYYKDGQKKFDGRYLVTKVETTDPPFKAGESLLIWDSIDASRSREAWQYLVGQRRVRKAPTVGYDTPDFVSSGANYFDEIGGFYGPPDRYEWKLVGKKELYIPYNNNKFMNVKANEAFAGYHLNPNVVRWELHRVWVVEATVAPGRRHVVPKRMFYMDEDRTGVSLEDGYDASGKLWRTIQLITFITPSIPMTDSNFTMVFNLQQRTYAAIQSLHEGSYKYVKERPMSFFSPDSLAAEGVR